MSNVHYLKNVIEEEYQKIGSDKKQSFTKNNKNKGIGKRVIILQKSRRDNTEYTDQKNFTR